jgi:hypothetical protein
MRSNPFFYGTVHEILTPTLLSPYMYTVLRLNQPGKQLTLTPEKVADGDQEGARGQSEGLGTIDTKVTSEPEYLLHAATIVEQC